MFGYFTNNHFYETIQHKDCYCVLDGSAITHFLWLLNPHWKLSDEALYAVVSSICCAALDPSSFTHGGRVETISKEQIP